VRLRLRRAVSVLLVAVLACGPQAVKQSNSSSESLESSRPLAPHQIGDGAPGRSTDEFWEFIGAAVGIVSGVISIVQFFQGTSPSNQQLSNEIEAVYNQDTVIEGQINQVLQAVGNTQIELNELSGQAIELDVDSEIANYMDVAVSDLNTYLYDRTVLGYPVNGATETIILGDALAGAQYFMQPAYYEVLSGTSYTWTPVYATFPFIRAVGIRLLALGSIYPGTFLNVTGVRTEMCGYQTFASELVTQTKAWADAQCGYSLVRTCTQQLCIPTKKPPCGGCLTYSYGYTISCEAVPGAAMAEVASGSGYTTGPAAQAAGIPVLASYQKVKENNIGLPQITSFAANLMTLVGHCP
jgi:hypothetical protein